MSASSEFMATLARLSEARGQALAQGIQNAATAQAQAQANSAQIWGQAVNQLGQIPQQYQQQQLQQQEMKLRTQQLGLQTDLTRAQLAALKREQQSQAMTNIVLSKYMTPGENGEQLVDMPGLMAELAKSGVTMEDQTKALEYGKALNAGITAQYQQQKEHAADQAHLLLNAFPGTDPIPPEAASAQIAANIGNKFMTQDEANQLIKQISQSSDVRGALVGIEQMSPSGKYKKHYVPTRTGGALEETTGEIIPGQESPATNKIELARAQVSKTNPDGTPKTDQQIARETQTIVNLNELATAPPVDKVPVWRNKQLTWVARGAELPGDEPYVKPTPSMAGPAPDQQTIDYWVAQVQRDPTQWNMLAGNKQLQQGVQQGLAKSGIDLDKLTAQSRAMAEVAREILPHLDTIRQEATELNDLGLMGPLRGRWRDLVAGKIGAGELVGGGENARKVGKFLTDSGLLVTAAARVHGGGRGGASPAMVEHMGELMDAHGKDLDLFLGNLDSTQEWMQGYAHMGQSATTTSKTSDTTTSDQSGGGPKRGDPPPPGVKPIPGQTNIQPGGTLRFSDGNMYRFRGFVNGQPKYELLAPGESNQQQQQKKKTVTVDGTTFTVR